MSRLWEMYGLNRTWCDVLIEMRDLCKCKKINPELMLSLVEELQVFGNRMEAKLNDVQDIESLHKEIAALKAKKAKLERKK